MNRDLRSREALLTREGEAIAGTLGASWPVLNWWTHRLSHVALALLEGRQLREKVHLITTALQGDPAENLIDDLLVELTGYEQNRARVVLLAAAVGALVLVDAHHRAAFSAAVLQLDGDAAAAIAAGHDHAQMHELADAGGAAAAEALGRGVAAVRRMLEAEAGQPFG